MTLRNPIASARSASERLAFRARARFERYRGIFFLALALSTPFALDALLARAERWAQERPSAITRA